MLGGRAGGSEVAAPGDEGTEHMQPLCEGQYDRIVSHRAFVEALARRVAASMPNSIEMSDLVQDGILGLIDAVNRYDEARGIRFETFAERRVRGAMIDALRRDAWPRGVRRMRRQIDDARDAIRREAGREPTLKELAARLDTDEERLSRTMVRIQTIESTSTSGSAEVEAHLLPAICLPSEPPAPDQQVEASETRDQVRRAIARLPERERRLIALYYYAEVTMKEIGAEIGVNESRVSQLHARALERLRLELTQELAPAPARLVNLSQARTRMAKAQLPRTPQAAPGHDGAVVLPYVTTSRVTRSKSASLNGLASHRQPLSSRKRDVSVPTMSPVTKITRRARDGALAAMAR
jgi:RNA polymerase sigma factor FliA